MPSSQSERRDNVWLVGREESHDGEAWLIDGWVVVKRPGLTTLTFPAWRVREIQWADGARY